MPGNKVPEGEEQSVEEMKCRKEGTKCRKEKDKVRGKRSARRRRTKCGETKCRKEEGLDLCL